MLGQFVLSLFVVIPLVSSPLLADLMDVSLTGSVGANVSVGPSGTCVPNSSGMLNFSQSMTQQGVGSYMISSSGGETCTTSGFSFSASGTAQQTATVTANSVSVTNVINGSINSGLSIFDEFVPDSVVQLSFDLTVPTIMDLTLSNTIGCTGIIMDCSSSMGSELFLPGSSLPVPYPGTFSTLMTLEPGSYSIEDDASTFAGTPAFASINSTLSFTADFMPVPEPRGSFVLVAVLAVLLCRLGGKRKPRQRAWLG